MNQTLHYQRIPKLVLVLVLPLIFRRRHGKSDALSPLAISLQPATVKTKLSWELPDAWFQRLLSWGPGALSIDHLAIMSDFIGQSTTLS